MQVIIFPNAVIPRLSSRREGMLAGLLAGFRADCSSPLAELIRWVDSQGLAVQAGVISREHVLVVKCTKKCSCDMSTSEAASHPYL